ncbi:MAG: nucleotide exchange factor GrpE [Pseudomonadota bacterium]
MFSSYSPRAGKQRRGGNVGEDEQKDVVSAGAEPDSETNEAVAEEAELDQSNDQEPDLALDEEAKLQVALDSALSAAEKHKDEALRAMAELENVRKRAEKDVEAAHKFGIEKFINELLPVKDSMDLGFDAANTATDVDSLKEGMSLTLKMFESALEKRGVQELNPAGESFDPEFHQAMMMEESVEVEAGKVLRVMQKGYLLNDRLIRPAMVVVAKKSAEE